MITYPTHEAKAKLSEILRRVRRGETIRITYHGEEIAEVRPISHVDEPEQTVERLVDSGILERAANPVGVLEAVANRPGALERFLADRE